MRPWALDLFCGAGGASMGLHRAGFAVVGVDNEPHPDYPFAFTLADALSVPLDGFSLIWASPVCKRYSMVTPAHSREKHPDQIARVRRRLVASGALWVIENVPQAPLRKDLVLCGRMFDLPLIRHRAFECSWPVRSALSHVPHDGSEVPVYGNGTSVWHKTKFKRGVDPTRPGSHNYTMAEKCAAMGIDWMRLEDLTQAVPPAYAEYVGRLALAQLGGGP